MSQLYNWKRFWYPLESEFKLTDFGFLSDPESEFGRITNPDAASLDSLSTIQCLILLGEPGIGKSNSLKKECEDFQLKAKENGDYVILLDLAGYSSEERLIRMLFDNLEFKNWINSKNKIYIFLDSLDECTIPLKSISSILVEELKEHSSDQLYLRIACRFLEWEDFIEADFKNIWKEENIKKYQLAPLRRKDVSTAAETNSIDSSKFLEQIIEKEIIPFAIKPVTLKFLINTYLVDGNFPQSQIELYKKGCQLLCTEINPNRRILNKGKINSPDQRLIIAARIATIMLFTNRNIIYKDIQYGKTSENEITISELTGNKETINGNSFSINEDEIREALSTALFIEYDPQRIGWAHQTYSEFLAAWYLIDRTMSFDQIQSLILHEDGKLIPQFYETAAWLAGMEENAFKLIFESDMEILLRGDLQVISNKNRSKIVDKLLELIKTKKLQESIELHRQYRKLKHPKIADQLHPIVIDKSQDNVLRRVAIDIAEDCELIQLQKELCTLALDRKESLRIRVNAAYAICRIGNPEIKKNLLPLALGKAGNDPDDELKGCGLRAVWPDHIDTIEFFNVLSPPKNGNLIGAYKVFINYQFLENLSENNLLYAIDWVIKIRDSQNYFSPFEETSDAILMKAWGYFDNQDIVKKFAEASYVSSKKGKPIIRDSRKHKFMEMIENDEINRRKLIKTIVPLMKDPEKDSSKLSFSGTRIALAKDVFWMIENLNLTKSEKRKENWSHLIDLVFELNNPRHCDAVITAAHRNNILYNILGWRIRPIELNSPEAKETKEHCKKIEKYKKEPPLIKPSPSKRIEKRLKDCEEGKYHIWWHLLQEMTLESRSQNYGYVYETVISSLPGWKDSSIKTRERMLNAGKELLINGDPFTNKWLGTHEFYDSALAGYKALEFFLDLEPDYVENLPNKLWKKWAPIILAFPTNDKDKESSYYRLLKLAYSKAPQEILKTLSVLINKENSDHPTIFIHRELESFWDNQLAKALMKKVKDSTLSSESMKEILDMLLTHNVKEAKLYAKSLLKLSSSKEENKFMKSVIAGQSLVRFTNDASWDTIWAIFKKNVEFGKHITKSISYQDRHEFNAIRKLSEIQLYELYAWLIKHFPPEKDLDDKQDSTVTSREMIGQWRNTIIYHLKECGTKESVNAIEKMIKRFPENKNLIWIYKDALSIYRSKSWQPLIPEEVRELIFNSEKRLIQNEEQLFDIVIEAIHRYQKKILGRYSPVEDLWNIDPHKPKDENTFSRHIARNLEDDLLENCILINREVETRKGQYTDIHVDFIVKDSRYQNSTTKRLTIIIEVKGCWHNELWEAMETQLVKKYLKNNQCQHGIYLVGWFACQYWNDCKKFNRSSLNIEESRIKLEDQANMLSNKEKKIKALILNTGLQ